MKPFLVILIFALTSLQLFGQQIDQQQEQFDAFFESGNFTGAHEVGIKILQKAEKEFSRRSDEYRIALSNMAAVLQATGKFEEALVYYNELILFEMARIDDNFPGFGASLRTVLDTYRNIDDFEVGIAVLPKAIERIRLIDTVDYSVFSELVYFYTDAVQVKYKIRSADPEDSLDSIAAKYGNNSPEYLKAVVELSDSLKTIGRYPEAMQGYLKYLAAAEMNSQGKSFEFAQVCLNVGYLNILSQSYSEAESYYLKGCRLFKDMNFGITEDYILAQYYLGLVYQMRQDWYQAVKYFSEAVSLYRKTSQKNNVMYSSSLMTLGTSYGMLGSFKEAEKCYDEYKSILVARGDTAPSYMMGYYIGIAPIYEKSRQYSKADTLYVKYNQACLDVVNSMSAYITIASEQKIAQSVSWFEYNKNSIYSYTYKRHKFYPALTGEIYNDELLFKGIILRLLKSKIEKVLTSGNEELIEEFNEWLAIRQRLAKLYQLPISDRKENVYNLETRIKKIENDIMSKMLIDNTRKEKLFDWKKIQEKLKEDEAAIEFLNFEYYDFAGDFWTDSIIYAAAVITKNCEYPEFVELFTEKEFSGFLERTKGRYAIESVRKLYSWPEKKNQGKGDSLYQYIWEPIEPYLKNVSKVYYSPSGLLHKISFNAVPRSAGELLIDVYSLQQMSTTSLLLSDEDEFKMSDKYKAMLYGGIFYDLGPEDFSKSLERYREEKPDFFVKDRSFEWSESIRGGGSWGYLEGTMEEVNLIENLFERSKIKTEVLTKDAAVEESIKYMRELPEILHIATHGFFIPEIKEKKKERYLDYNTQARIDPDAYLQRSGLLFAGANNVWKGSTIPDGAEDGILTSYEISRLNLSKTKLVVLSACETGLGEIKGAEGVYGLQRAFKMAGAEYVIMSLWQIPDAQTVELMQQFYKNWLQGNDIREAFYAAQKEMSLKYEPFFWSAFVLVE